MLPRPRAAGFQPGPWPLVWHWLLRRHLSPFLVVRLLRVFWPLLLLFLRLLGRRVQDVPADDIPLVGVAWVAVELDLWLRAAFVAVGNVA